MQDQPIYTRKVDIWAAGCIFYEIVSRRKAFQNDWQVKEYSASLRKLEFPQIDFHYGNSARFFQETVVKMLQRYWVQRPTAETLIHDFQKFEAGLAVGSDLSPIAKPLNRTSLILDPFVLGEDSSEQRITSIEKAIPQPGINEHLQSDNIAAWSSGFSSQLDLPHDATEAAFANLSGQLLNDPGLDRENGLLREWRDAASQKLVVAQYNEAELLLQRTLRLSEAKFGTDFPERNQILEMLASVYVRMGKWNAAEKIFLGILKSTTQVGKREVKIMHGIAEVYFALNNLDSAETFCQKAIQEWERILVQPHVLLYLSIDLLAKIYRTKGVLDKAEAYEALLPPSIEGIVPKGKTQPLI